MIWHQVHQSVHDGDSEWQYDKHDLHKRRTDDGITTGENELHCEKHDLQKCITDDGIIIIVILEEENADSSICCKFDPDSSPENY
jgi:hypothetical protein